MPLVGRMLIIGAAVSLCACQRWPLERGPYGAEIRNHRVAEGMSPRDVLKSWGRPDFVQRDEERTAWHYGYVAGNSPTAEPSELETSILESCWIVQFEAERVVGVRPIDMIKYHRAEIDYLSNLDALTGTGF